MARRTKTASRLELRKAAEAAEGSAAVDAPKKKATRAPTKRKSSKKKVVATRFRMMWGVFDNSNQQVAAFPYNDRPSADKKATDMNERGRGPYFVQPVKEPIMEVEEEPTA